MKKARTKEPLEGPLLPSLPLHSTSTPPQIHDDKLAVINSPQETRTTTTANIYNTVHSNLQNCDTDDINASRRQFNPLFTPPPNPDTKSTTTPKLSLPCVPVSFPQAQTQDTGTGTTRTQLKSTATRRDNSIETQERASSQAPTAPSTTPRDLKR